MKYLKYVKNGSRQFEYLVLVIVCKYSNIGKFKLLNVKFNTNLFPTRL
jgi:hypothetical protein